MKHIGLATLLAPVTEDAFFKSYWPGKPLFIPASPNKLQGLFELPELQDLDSLIKARTLSVRACLPDYDDEYSSILIGAEDAVKAYRNNMTLVFDSMQTQSETIHRALEQIRLDLGLVTGSGGQELTRSRSIAYATPAGGRTRLHFDANANFVVQVKGTKRWMLAPNTSVDSPTERYTSCTGELAGELEKQCHAPLLDELPHEHLEFLLTPGCVLFVPRGYWHETTTEDDSLSINFTFSQPAWADIFAKSIHGHLLQSSQWRELADGLESSDPKRNAKAVAHFENLAREFASELPRLLARDLLAEANLLAKSH